MHDKDKIIVIAEAGVNHNGDIALAKKLIETAKSAGADIVKFQTFKTKNMVSKFAQKADYQKKMTSDGENQLIMLNQLEISEDGFSELFEYARALDMQMISTPFDIESIAFLNKENIKLWKIPSGEITNLPFLLTIAKTGKPVILSTGMSDLNEIESAVNILKDNGTSDITLLHCTTEYPTPYEDVNLKAMITLKETFGLPVGYSDHTNGIEVAIAAAALGAVVIEKHFTLDKNMPGPDHKASLEPHELKDMVKSIRNIEKSIGSGIKIPAESEVKNINIARKSITAKTNIKAGEVFSEDNITAKRPGNGISPMQWFNVVGTRAKRDFKEDELIEI